MSQRRARQRSLIALVCALLVLASCASVGGGAQPTPRPTATPSFASLFTPHLPVTVREDVAYGHLPEQILDLCTPLRTSTPRPGIVLIHGGAFVGGDKHYQFDDYHFLSDVCKGLASQGFVVANIDFRTASSVWPAPLEDAQLAVRWLHANAASLGLDAQRICAAGLSSGAYLAVFLGVLQQAYPGDQAETLAGEPSHVSCVVDFYGPVDLAELVKTAPAANFQVVLILMGAETLESNPQRYHAASPLFYVSRQSAPMLIVHGTHDDTVPPAQSQALLQALQQQGVPAQFIAYEGKHSFGGLSEQQIRELWGQALRFIADHTRA